jgi:hypothetical protein
MRRRGWEHGLYEGGYHRDEEHDSDSLPMSVVCLEWVMDTHERRHDSSLSLLLVTRCMATTLI